MPMLTATIQNEREAGVLMEEMSQQLHDAYLAKIKELTPQLMARVQSAVPVASGALQHSIQMFVDDSRGRIAGKVKVIGATPNDFGKAGAIEYGAHGQAKVSAHTRQIKVVFGRLVAPVAAVVAAYSRTLDIAPRSFLRSPLASMESQIVAELAAVPAAVAARS
jgi:hypothetical protein